MKRVLFAGLLAGLGFAPTISAAEGLSQSASASVPRLIISTDIAAGLVDTHGGQSLVPVPFDADHGYTSDTNVVPQDFDDGLAVAAALNMDAAGLVDILAIVPTFGNATLPAEMAVARFITQTLKGRDDIPVVAGALLPAGQIFNPTATWFDGSPVKVTGRNGSFAAACRNPGVEKMEQILLQPGSFGMPSKVTILAIGPATDIACLLLTSPKSALKQIEEIIFLASQLDGEVTEINGIPINDFNVRMDPIAAAMALAVDRVNVPMRFMTFQLTSGMSQKGNIFAWNKDTYPGPPRPATKQQITSYRWLIKASKARREYFTSIFGTPEGPFDQFTLIAALRPDLFDCVRGRVYLQMCPYPAWSKKYPVDANGDPTQEPYNAANNPCPNHGGIYSESLSVVPAVIFATQSTAKKGKVVKGKDGIDGNLPTFGGKPARKALVCTGFVSEAAKQMFKDLLTTWTW